MESCKSPVNPLNCGFTVVMYISDEYFLSTHVHWQKSCKFVQNIIIMLWFWRHCPPVIMCLYLFSRNCDDNITHYRDSFVEVMNEIDTWYYVLAKNILNTEHDAFIYHTSKLATWNTHIWINEYPWYFQSRLYSELKQSWQYVISSFSSKEINLKT